MLSPAWTTVCRTAVAARRIAAHFTGSKHGVAALEFAIMFPVLTVLLASGFELSRAVAASTRATYAANALAELTSQATTPLTPSDLNRIIETAALQNPDILRYAHSKNRSDFWNLTKVTVSSVVFSETPSGCSSSCEYRADMVFSYSPTGAARPCGTLGQGLGASNLPAEVFGQGTLIVVDVEIPYEAVFPDVFDRFSNGGFTFDRTVYLRPRYIDLVESTDHNCPNF